ncbi:hypothetical protein J5N58_24385 [Rhizobium cremeum]|uniref:hypothetical protein n=1 Tax=Rhizobium cremeum TaxID=2813827 RepID=UPI001FD577FB|nr:hypothetical protein [Rhizobium cremeum]MCJ7997732.1 hypothetical protein [Rhizobium cremeum]MCJ8002826.1 hypothetical protein [Rhizobium cremeum]
MELYIKGFVTASINNIDLKTTLTRRELNDRQARGKTRAAIRRDVFFDTVRDALLSANFDKVDGDWDAAATERAKLDYIRRLAPFLLPDLAHTAAAFVVDRSFLKPTLGDACSSDEITAATAVLQTRESTYVEFPHETFLSSGEVGARMVIITTVDAQRFKWSAVLEPTGEFAETCVVSWYVTRGIAEPYTNVIFAGKAPVIADWTRICDELTRLVHACLACISCSARSSASTSRRQTEQSSDPSCLATEVADTYPGFHFRVERLTAEQRDAGALRANASGKALSKHIVVAGYFKNVACGKGRQERRRTWIPEHHKGPIHQPIETKVPLFRVG